MNKAVIKPQLGSFLIFLVLAASGNTEFRQSQYTNLFILIFILATTYKYITRDFIKKYFLLVSGLTILFILQLFVLGSVTYFGIINMYVKIFIAGWVVYINKDLFVNRFLNVMYILSIISLVFFIVDIVSGGIYKVLPPVFSQDNRYYYFLYATRIATKHQYIRNSGMFWEPGVFSSYLIVCLAFVYPLYDSLTKISKRKIIVVFVALLTTFSTTGYLVVILVFMSRLLITNKLGVYHILYTTIILIVSIIVFNNSIFLKNKLTQQTETAISARGNFNKTRLGSLLFDLYYVKKHPIVGNGIYRITEYADDYYLKYSKGSIGNGNGFSQFIKSYGLVFTFFFFYLLFIRINNIYRNRKFAILFVIIFILNLQGEPLMTYPFYWGLIFLNTNYEQQNQINNHYSRL